MKRTASFLLILVVVLAGVTQAQSRHVLLSEDFEELVLGPNVDEGRAGEAVWTDVPPAGWINDANDVPGIEDPSTDGVTEWAGWGFADKEWWIGAAEDQNRSEFTLGQGTVAIADPDEWDDQDHPAVPDTGTYTVWLHTAPISLTTSKPGTVRLAFDSSWRPEYDGDYHQTATVRVAFDGGEPIELLLWESDSGSSNYKDYATNETVTVEIDNPGDAESMVLTFGMYDAGNDWWWAVDNIMVTAERSAELAYNPSPADGEVEVAAKTLLSWTPGAYVAGSSPQHRILLSDDRAAVEDGSAVVATQNDASFDAAGLLDYSTTYYWRVDEANSVTGWDEGVIWTFTTEAFVYTLGNITASSNVAYDATAEPQNVVNGSGLDADDTHSNVSSDMWLTQEIAAGETVWIQFDFDGLYKLYDMTVWNYNGEFEFLLGFGIQTATVEYSADGATWATLGQIELTQSTGASSYGDTTTMAFEGVAAQAVRLTVDAGFSDRGQYGLCEVRFNYIPTMARTPQPANDANDVALADALTWRAGREAVTHEVYLSADEAAVADGTALVDTTTVSSLATSDLEFATTYYWRVDEVNEAAETTVWPGKTWTFVTEDSATLDDFEAYNDEDNLIYETWIDGWYNGTGSTVGYWEAPFAERMIVNSGRQSMPLAYDNSSSPYYSEAGLDLAGADLTAHGADCLVVYFQGEADAEPAPVYVAIEDGSGNIATASYSDPQATLLTEWQAWHVPFSELSGADLSNVAMFYIGVGDRANPSSGGSGTIYVDDVGYGRLSADQ